MSGDRTDDPAAGLPRRRLLLSMAGGLGVGAAAGRIVSPGPAHATPAPRAIVSVPTVGRLGDVEPTERLAFAEGLRAPGDGAGGLFVWRAEAADAAQPDAQKSDAQKPGDGFVQVAGRAGAAGTWTRLDGEGGAVRPEWFGSLAYERDHAPILQRAIDHVAATGGGVVDLGSRTYRCLSAITMDPTLCALSASGATLDFSERDEVVPAGPENAVSLDDLGAVASGPWSRRDGTLQRRGFEPRPLALTRRLAAGERHRVEIGLARLQGDPNSPFLRIEVTGAATGRAVRKIVLTAACHVAFEFDAPDEDCILALSSNSDVDIDRFDLAPTGRRECLLIRCRETSPQYGHRWIEGLRLRGPGMAGRRTQLEAIRFETQTPALASRLAMRDVMVEGFGTALLLSHRCYLAQFTSCRFVSEVGVQFLAGSEDAGENIGFFGCAIGGGRIGIWNAGAELHLFGTSVNFCDQFYVGTGSLQAFGCHFETERTQRPDQYLFDVGKGIVRIEGGTMLVSGRDFDKGNEADHVVMVRARLARFSMTGVVCYNLRSRTGIFAGGAGTVRLADLAGDARRFVAPVPKRDLATNLFGPASRLDGTAGELPVRLVGSSGGPAPATLERLAPETETETETENGTEAENGTGPGLLAITKSGEAGAELWCWLLVRCLPGMRAAWALDLKAVPAPGAAGADPERALALDVLFCDGGLRGEGAPTAFVTAKRPISIALAELADWDDVVGSTHDTREDEWGDGTAPAFATHLALRLDLADLAAGDRILLRAPYAGAA